jgi:hypothetical protein
MFDGPAVLARTVRPARPRRPGSAAAGRSSSAGPVRRPGAQAVTSVGRGVGSKASSSLTAVRTRSSAARAPKPGVARTPTPISHRSETAEKPSPPWQ